MALASGIGQGLWGGTTGLSVGSGISAGSGLSEGGSDTLFFLTNDAGTQELTNDAGTQALTSQ